MKRRIYIAGPMTGLPEHNYPAFHKAAAEWRAKGWDVANPAESFGGSTEMKYITYAMRDVNLLKESSAIALLPGWDSPTARGSVWEYAIATQILNIDVYDATQPVLPEVRGTTH